MLYQFIFVVHIILALAIIGLVLMQHGKGADVGAAFGSGASNTIFGSQGTGNFLYKATFILALLFSITSISLTAFVDKYDRAKEATILDKSLDLKGVESKAEEINNDSLKKNNNTDVPVINDSVEKTENDNTPVINDSVEKTGTDNNTQ